MTKYNQCKKFINLSKVFVLGFGMQVGSFFRTRDDDLKTKSLTPSYNLDLKPSGSCNSQPLKKPSYLHMLFKVGSSKNFAIFTGKHLCWALFLIKFKGLQLFKNRLQHRCFFVDIAKFLVTSFLSFTRTPVTVFASPTTLQ